MRIYLAGPDVFHPQARAIGAAKQALCASRGFIGLFPLDEAVAPGTDEAMSRSIYENCLTMMAAADVGLFNLTPFRGPSADPGTVLELGHMAALGKPVFAYTNAGGDLITRLRDTLELTQDGAAWRDADGLEVEDFGNVDNLMIDGTLAAQGRRIHRNAVAQADRATDLAGFTACLDEITAWVRRFSAN